MFPHLVALRKAGTPTRRLRTSTRSISPSTRPLGNEPRCKGCNTDVIYKWATDISAYIRSLDPNHMITLGNEGFGLPGQTSYPYQYSEAWILSRTCASRIWNFATFHMYPGSWGVPNNFGPGWIRGHAAACKAAGEPCLLEEHGVTSDHCNVERPGSKLRSISPPTAWRATCFGNGAISCARGKLTTTAIPSLRLESWCLSVH
ncbi:hypothetical protein VTK56DRAFT_4441 [Thermocarpiscus australiensis]